MPLAIVDDLFLTADLDDLRVLLDRVDPDGCDCEVLYDCPCRQECPVHLHDRCPACLLDLGFPWWEGFAGELRYCSAHCKHCREECDCLPAPVQPFCNHFGEPDPADEFAVCDWYENVFRGGKAATFDEQVAALRRYLDPDEYRAPRECQSEPHVINRDARIATMEMRRRKGQKLFHPRDGWQKTAAVLKPPETKKRLSWDDTDD